MADKLLRSRDVQAKTTLSSSTIYDWMQQDKFPKPISLGNKKVAWRESDIDAWIEQQANK